MKIFTFYRLTRIFWWFLPRNRCKVHRCESSNYVYSPFKDDGRRRGKVDPSPCWNLGEYSSLPGSSIHQSTGEGLLPASGAHSNISPDLEAGVFIFFANYNHLIPPRIWGMLLNALILVENQQFAGQKVTTMKENPF